VHISLLSALIATPPPCIARNPPKNPSYRELLQTECDETLDPLTKVNRDGTSDFL
jgi:hypothetical protein